jgi:hypothetical protein
MRVAIAKGVAQRPGPSGVKVFAMAKSSPQIERILFTLSKRKVTA